MNKKFLLVLVFGMFFVSFVSAAITISVPVVDTNYTTSLSLDVAYTNASADMTDALQANTTCYYNASGTWASVGTLSSFVVSATGFTATVDLSTLNDGEGISFNCTVGNDTLLTNAAMINNIIFDSTAPNVSTFYNTVDGGSYSDSTVLNVSISDATIGVGSVYFNITNSTGEQVNWTVASGSGGYYSLTLVTSSYSDGLYNFTVYANDSLNNENHTGIITITMDNTHPVPSALTSSSATTSSLTITFSGGEGTCTASGTGTKTVSTSTLTVTGLSCGTSYSYTITCTDTAGNAGASSATSFSTTSCGSAATTSSTSQYTNTYVVSGEQFQQGYTKEIAINNRAKVKVGASYHYVGVKSLTASTATIEIASDPVEVTLDVGEEIKIDVTEDGYYDIYVKLIDLVNNKANLLIKEVYEEIPEGEGDLSTSGEVVDDEDEEVEKDLTWLWVSIGVLVIVGGLAILLKMKKKKFSGSKKQ